MTTLCSSPSSPRFFATKSELYKAPFLSFSILKRCHSRPPRNLNSNDSTYRDGNLFTICTSRPPYLPLATSRFKLFLDSGKDAVSDLQTLVSLDVQEINYAVCWRCAFKGGLQGRPKLVVRRDRSLGWEGSAQNNFPKWWPASLPRHSLEVDKEDYQREVALMGLKPLGNVVTTDLLRISACRKVDPCTGPEKC
ncbi:hypothetical protein IGI04_040377 [Brassica rapa subsp. trilocularis]|uniref:Uncharacterized protein n=1 Tax=Brassica rapa subsp. trilocularis TaxID=1813537 RepID=A0ABQ7KP24_BRACM|nr:hypothetical protein IGI04_040377 [Brassica rapa subsp. trilocularis]